jgi:hypothetical protein
LQSPAGSQSGGGGGDFGEGGAAGAGGGVVHSVHALQQASFSTQIFDHGIVAL